MRYNNLHPEGKMTPKAIIFDWDDTLAQTRTAIVSAMEYTLKQYQKEPWDITKLKYRDPTKSLKENFPNFFGEKYQEAYDTYLSYYRNHVITQIHPTPNAKEFLKQCLKNNIEIYIISNKEKSLLLQEVKQCFPNITFKNILGNGDAPQNKPAPAPVFKALTNATYPINKETVWLIGDSKQDITCALAANILPILIGQGKFIENTKDLNQIRQIKNFIELINT